MTISRFSAQSISRSDVTSGRIPTAYMSPDPRSPAVEPWEREAEVVLCNAPLVSVVRPSLGLGLLQASLETASRSAASCYLNVFFADKIGLALNEDLAERTPSQLLIGDWLFSAALGARGRRETPERYLNELERAVGRKVLQQLVQIREVEVPAFIDEYAEKILAMKPRIVVFSTVFQQTAASLAFSIRLKQLAENLVICMGGANCHGRMGEAWLRNFPCVDYVFTGEADASFPSFVEHIINRGRNPSLPSGIIGHGNPDRGSRTPAKQMDELPYPQFDDYFRQVATIADANRIQTSVPFEASRGCWWGQKQHCTFCGLNGESMRFREKEPHRVLAEVDYLRERYGVFRFLATDDIMSMRHIDAVFGTLAKREAGAPGNSFFYEVKSNLGESHLRILAEAGVTFVQPGIESFSDQVLSIMRKGVSGALNLRFLRNCSEIGIAAAWSILFGFPGESLNEYEAMTRLVPLIEHLQPPMGLSAIRLDRFSPNFEQFESRGFDRPAPFMAYESIYDLDPADIERVAYFFTANGSGVNARALDPLAREISRWQRSWHDFAARPRLEILEGTEFDLIHDTRSCAQVPLSPLSGQAREVLAAARSPLTLNAICARVRPESTNALERIVEELIEMKFLLDWNGTLLALPTRPSGRILDYDVRAALPYGYILRAENSAAEQDLQKGLCTVG